MQSKFDCKFPCLARATVPICQFSLTRDTIDLNYATVHMFANKSETKTRCLGLILTGAAPPRCCVGFIEAIFGHSLGPGEVRGIAPLWGREEIGEPCGRTLPQTDVRLKSGERNRVVLVRGKRFHNGSHRLRRGILLFPHNVCSMNCHGCCLFTLMRW